MEDESKITLLDAEWKLIEPLLQAQLRLQAQLNAYISIIQARAGLAEKQYVLDPVNKQLISR